VWADFITGTNEAKEPEHWAIHPLCGTGTPDRGYDALAHHAYKGGKHTIDDGDDAG